MDPPIAGGDQSIPRTQRQCISVPIGKRKDLIMTMNSKMNTIIDEEVGIDDGSSIGLKEDTDYGFSRADI